MARYRVKIRLKVKEVATSRGLTRAQLARRADINYETMLAVWGNPYHAVALATLVKIARALSVDISELYEEVQDD